MEEEGLSHSQGIYRMLLGSSFSWPGVLEAFVMEMFECRGDGKTPFALD